MVHLFSSGTVNVDCVPFTKKKGKAAKIKKILDVKQGKTNGACRSACAFFAVFGFDRNFLGVLGFPMIFFLQHGSLS